MLIQKQRPCPNRTKCLLFIVFFCLIATNFKLHSFQEATSCCGLNSDSAYSYFLFLLEVPLLTLSISSLSSSHILPLITDTVIIIPFNLWYTHTHTHTDFFVVVQFIKLYLYFLPLDICTDVIPCAWWCACCYIEFRQLIWMCG